MSQTWIAVGYLAIILVLAPVLSGGTEPMTEDQAVVLAIETLRNRFEEPTVDIEVQAARAVEWTDAGLGCQRQSETDSELTVPGFLVRLIAKGRDYRVHVGAGRAVICPRPSEQKTQLTPGETIRLQPESEAAVPLPRNEKQRRMVEQAMDDLAERREVTREEIDLLAIRLVIWPDSSLGCPRPGINYTQATKEGYQIVLQVGRRRYAYHAGLGGEPFFCEHPTQPVSEEIGPGAGSDQNR